MYRQGTRKNGRFFIRGVYDVEVSVFCDFESEANSTWTLITSFEFVNRHIFNFPYFTDEPKNSASPSFKYYR